MGLEAAEAPKTSGSFVQHLPVIAIDERFQRPSVMGIVNVTPDSFSDGGANLAPDVAAQTAHGQFVELVDGERVRLRPWAIRWCTPE